MTAIFCRFFVPALAISALLIGCGEANPAVNGVFVADVGVDAVPLADADTADAADGAGDVAIAPDATPDAGTDAVESADADADASEDAATDAGGTDTAAPDVADDASPDGALDAADADVADVAVDTKCASASDCPSALPYCGASGSCVACNFSSQCPGDGAFCLKNACSTAVNCASDKDCTPLGAVCDTSKGVCRECLSAADCLSGQTCKANQCQTITPCQSSKECPGALVCSASQCVECAADTDCLGSQFCSNNLCTTDVCKPGAHCELNSVATCKANGGGWDYSDCGFSAICLGGTCAPVICQPNATTCQNGSLVTCNALGTATTLTGCSSQETCEGTTCAPVICPPKTIECDGTTSLKTCSALGTTWSSSPCGGGFVCEDKACVAQVCTPAAKSCTGTTLLLCDALGVWKAETDCAQQGLACVTDKCADKVCVANTVKCDGDALSQCNADGMGWTPIPCGDSDACTSDTCDPIGLTCVHPALNCDDGNVCTTDSCSGGCVHAGVTGPACDDGNACSTGEVCNAGSCVAPTSVGTVSTIAGSGSTGSTNGAGSSASFNGPTSLARMADGSFLVADQNGNRIRQIQPDGTVSTFAGTGAAGSSDGLAASATFNVPVGLAINSANEVFISDWGNNRIRKISSGSVTTFAGSSSGYKDGAGTNAQFSEVTDVKFDVQGTLWVAERGNNRIRKIAPDGTVTTAAGSGTASFLDGAASTAQFKEPCGVAPASDGSVYIADSGNYRIRKLSADGTTVSTFAGAGSGYLDGPGSSAKFDWVPGLALRGNTLLVADYGNNRIRLVAADGTVSTLSGSGTAGYIDGAPSSAQFSAPSGLALDWSGNAWIADKANQRIRKLAFSNLLCDDGNPCTVDSCGGSTCTFTPLPTNSACSDGSACTVNDACNASGKCTGIATVCSDGNPCTSDTCNPVTGACAFPPSDGPCVDNDVCTTGEHCVGGACKANIDTMVTIAGSNASGYVDGAGKDARFNAAFGLALTKNGGAYVAEANGNRIRLVGKDGVTTTAAGSGTAGYIDGAASTAQFNNPTRLLLDDNGTLYIADAVNSRIRKLVGQTVSTVAGSGTAGFLDGAPTSAQFNNPFGMVLTANGTLLIADSGNHRIRTINTADGTVGTLAGSGTSGSTDGALASATFNSPRGLCQSSSGIVYVVDTLAHTIRRIIGGQVDTLAGTTGVYGHADGVGTQATFNQPRDCTVDPNGNVYVADTYNNRLRKITPNGVVTTLAGTTIGGGSTLTYTDGSALATVMSYPAVPAWAPGGVIWVADNNAVRKFVPANVDCGDGQLCTTDVCNGATGACSNTAIPNNGSCDDGFPCIVGEFCTGGVCGGGKSNNCDDSDPCTVDSCDTYTGCSHVANFTAPGCCKPTLFQTGFEGDSGSGSGSGNGIKLSNSSGASPWSIGTPSKVHAGSGGMAITTLSGTSKSSATLPTFTLPTGTNTLSFWLYLDATPNYDSFYGCYDGSVSVQVLVAGISVYSASAATSGWKQVTFSSSLAAGSAPSVVIQFTSAQQYCNSNGSYYSYSSTGTGIFIDDIQITSTCQ
jgi:hypothetical protein